jgi:hypothetical protein
MPGRLSGRFLDICGLALTPGSDPEFASILASWDSPWRPGHPVVARGGPKRGIGSGPVTTPYPLSPNAWPVRPYSVRSPHRLGLGGLGVFQNAPRGAARRASTETIPASLRLAVKICSKLALISCLAPPRVKPRRRTEGVMTRTQVSSARLLAYRTIKRATNSCPYSIRTFLRHHDG